MLWPFRRRPRAEAAQAAPPPPPVRRDWALLPPIEPAVGPAPLVAQRAPHQPGLAVPGPAATVLAPLGHHRSDAPRGTVVALAIGVAPARAPLPPLLAPGRARPAPPVGHGEIPAIEPLRVLSAVDDPSGSDEPTVQGSLTRSPLPGVAEGSREQPHSGVVHPEPALVQRAAEGAAAAAAAAARRPSLGQSRRLGIGAPFSREPAHSPVDAHGVPTEASGISPVERLGPPPAPQKRVKGACCGHCGTSGSVTTRTKNR